jgi:UDP-glucose 4-epimerase
MIEDAAVAFGLQCISLRYFNPVGAHPSARIGELPIGRPNNLVPFITQTAAGLRDDLTVYGGDYPTPDGTCIRDYIHVVDVATAHVAALNRLLNSENNASPEFFNLGTGQGHSVLEVIKAFEQSTGQKLKYTIGPRRHGDVARIYSDTKKANQILGWTAKEDLASMMKTAWEWQLNIPKYFG